MDSIKVETLLKDQDFDLRLELLAGEGGLDRRVVSSRIQKPGLALSGFTEHIHKDRLQVFGNTEISYLATLRHDEALKRVRDLFRLPIACLVVTKNLPVEDWVKREASDARVPLLRTSHLSSTFIDNIERFLQEALTASTSVHGVLIDVIGVGVLILGKSGIGKSELALDLVTRGHRLVADDIVDLKKKQGGSVYGSGSEIIKHHMEIRGIGIINIKDLFGVSAVRERKKVEMVVELVEWDDKVEYDRLGVEEQKYTILDIEAPLLVIPVRPGRNLTTIVEVAARNHLPKLLELVSHGTSDEVQRLAIVVDAREGRFLDSTPGAIEEVRREGHQLEVVFFDCADDVLIRRFSETRRRHPLSPDGSVEEGIAEERRMLAQLRALADQIVDTSRMNVHELRDAITAKFGAPGEDDKLNVTLLSFGFRNGIPEASDLVFDVRFLPTPYFVEGLKPYPGTDPRVSHWVLERMQTQEFLARLESLLQFLIPQYRAEGKSYLTVSIGCTGGRHRSVVLAEELGRRLTEKHRANVKVTHRDVMKS